MNFNNYYKLLIAFLGLIFFHSNIFSQTITISPVLGYGQISVNAESQVDKFSVRELDDRHENTLVGLSSRIYFNQNRFYVQSSLTYGRENLSPAYAITNSNPQEYTYLLFDEESQSFSFANYQEFSSQLQNASNQVFRLSLSSGAALWKPKNWFSLRAFGGLSLDYRMQQEGNRERINDFLNRANSVLDDSPTIDSDIFLAGVLSSERNWVLQGQLGLGIDIDKFWLDITYLNSLNSLNRDVSYYDEFYEYKVNTSQLLFTIGWNITLRNKN